MTHVIRVKNVNHAFCDGFWWLKTAGLRENSRNGPVIVAPGPVITEYVRPWERILFHPERDANPIFHLMESIWMLAGESDVEWLSQFSKNIANYAEPSGTIHGAYGHRWRNHWSMDQIYETVKILTKDPDSRQAVVQMWDVESDLGATKRDLPCNTSIFFDTRRTSGGIRRLNMTVCCRSNDALWGCYGANVVHFSVLQEVMASALGVQMGVYRQMSNNFHAYEKTASKFLTSPPEVYDEYAGGVGSISMLGPHEGLGSLLGDCQRLASGEDRPVMVTKFMKEIAAPLCAAYLKRKADLDWDILDVPDCDWKLAFRQWVIRREL